MVTVGGYHAIALPLAHGMFKRYIYVKKHLVKDSDKSSGESILAADRTVYIVNLPTTSDEQWLRQTLTPLGAIQHIVAGPQHDESDPLLAKAAHIVFKAKKAVDAILSVSELECELREETPGLQAYLKQYRANKPGLEAVKNLADKYMAAFDAKEEEELQRLEELKNQVDDDGFVTVVSSKRKKPLPEEFAPPVKKQKSKELENFYRFQMREKKRDQLKSLRERFEEDRELVEKLKKANRFKPE